MKEYLEAVQNKLMEQVPELKYVDEDWGQLDDYSPNYPVKWPCCLIDLQSANFSDIGPQRGNKPERRQEATATIVLTVANLKLTNSSGKAPVMQKQSTWFIYDLIKKVHEELHGYRPVVNGGCLMRVSDRKVKRDDGVQMRQVVYTIGMHNV